MRRPRGKKEAERKVNGQLMGLWWIGMEQKEGDEGEHVAGARRRYPRTWVGGGTNLLRRENAEKKDRKRFRSGKGLKSAANPYTGA